MKPWDCGKRQRTPGNRAQALEQGATFKVDYFFYCTVVLTLLGIVLFALHLSGRRRLQDRQMKLAERARKRRAQDDQRAKHRTQILPHQQVVLQRQLKGVPTPWGWPGSASQPASREGHATLPAGSLVSSGVFQRWIDHLVAEKRTVEDQEYRESRHAALRSMVEDRFGRSTPQPQEMAYQKVRPPKLADPTRPHDQMDNFPSGKTEHIVSGLKQQRGATGVPVSRRKAALGDIKTPWGW